MTPEEKARQQIDLMLVASGWIIQDRADLDIHAGLGVVVREFPLKGGDEADYLLYVDGAAAGVVEAKPTGTTLTGVETQSGKYLQGFPDEYPAHRRPLPFAYESTGTETHFTNGLDPAPRSREVFSFHRPQELLRLLQLDRQARAALQEMPAIDTTRLWPAQIEAITNLERSLATGQPRSLLQMTTGSGKTYTAVAAVYRMVKFGSAKRVLFLVDRANLGQQTFREFQRYVSPYNGRTFTDEFNVQLLASNTIDPVSRVCITTVQRLYSMLQGEEAFDDENEATSLFERGWPLTRDPAPVVYNARIPIETFDVIIVDECHRSIYNLWRQVLDYFDAFLIGLTATPSKQTVGFFQRNLIMEYGHEQAVVDNVNVGCEIYRIRTKITEGGATLEGEPGMIVPRRERKTRRKRYAELDEDLTYTARQLDRDVVAEKQIRLVIQTFRDRLFTEIFPERQHVPKTLVFAKDDSHAEDITRIVRQEFGQGNEFCQKITYRTTGKKPEDILAEFRNSYYPRIAITVDMVATGTDVKPLECLLFLRNVKSATYFEQMKGRGVRVVDLDTLQAVTPDAEEKIRFVIVDAVGVCEEARGELQPLERKPSVPLGRLLESIAMGNTHSDLVSTLAGRLIRLDRRIGAIERQELTDLADGRDLHDLASALVRSIDPDVALEALATVGELGEGEEEPSPDDLRTIQQRLVREALHPFRKATLRRRIIAIGQADEQVIDDITEDELRAAGYDDGLIVKASALVTNFRDFIDQNRDEIEALQVLYSRPYRAGLRWDQIKGLAAAVQRPPLGASPETIWRAFQVINAPRATAETLPEYVAEDGRKRPGQQLADLISLVRHAIDPEEPLLPFADTVAQRYAQWLAEQEAAGAGFTPEQAEWLAAIRDHIATSVRIDAESFDLSPLNELGGLGRAYQVFGSRLQAILDELNERLAA